MPGSLTHGQASGVGTTVPSCVSFSSTVSGTIRAESQEVFVRGNNRRLTDREIAELPLIAKPDGAVLEIMDLAVIRDEFVDTAAVSEIDGQPVVVLSIKRATTEDLLAMVDSVKEFGQRQRLPKARPIAKTSYRSVGSQIANRGHLESAGSAASGGAIHLGGVEVELVDASLRDHHSDEIVARWRENGGSIPGVEDLTFGGAAVGPGAAPIEFKLTANRQGIEHLDEVVEQCKAGLEEFPGVFDITDDSLPGKFEFRLRVKPEAMAIDDTEVM